MLESWIESKEVNGERKSATVQGCVGDPRKGVRVRRRQAGGR